MNKKILLGFMLSLSFTLSYALSDLKVEGRSFKDKQGRTVILRGFNVAGDSKVPPFMPINDTNLLAPLKTMGSNVIRLLFTWEAFEPVKGQYYTPYLDYYTSIIQWAQANKMFVIVDIHQDAFSRFSVGGCGDGFPSWTVHSSIKQKTPDNVQCKTWGARMIVDRDMHKSWHHFYANSEGARDAYLSLLGKLAKEFKDYSNVIGYDFINEPWGNENTELSPLYEEAAAVIRAEDPEAILFVSPHALLSSGVSSTRLKKPTFTNYVFSPHYYSPTVITTKIWLAFNETGVINSMNKQAKTWGVPLFLGEFGAPNGTVRGVSYINALYNALNDVQASGSQWSFTPGWSEDKKDGWNMEDFSVIDGTGNPRAMYVPRAYPQAVAGEIGLIKDTGFGTKKGQFILNWTHHSNLGSTEIFVPPSLATTMHIDTDPLDVNCEYNATSYLLTCTYPHDTKVTVVLNTI